MLQKTLRTLLFALLLSAGSLLCRAADMPAFTVLYPENAMRYGPSVKTGAGKGTLIAFWRSDCAPCVAEQPALNEIARKHRRLTIALVSLDGDAYTERHFAPPGEPNIEIWAARDDAETTLRRMGDTRTALPFSVYLRADGSTCDTHNGILGTAQVEGWMKRC